MPSVNELFQLKDRIKSDVRSCLSASTLEHIIRISGEGPGVEEYDPAKDMETWFSTERKIIKFKYQNLPSEEDIEFKD